MKLSERLETIIDMAPQSEACAGQVTIADVGTDHGFVPIRLVQDGKADRAIAMDVRPGPLARAKEHVAAYGLEEQIDIRLSDGLQKLREGEADGVIIAGMGGDLMLRILQQGEHVRGSIRWWVLSPQSELAEFRHGLERLGLAICEERMVYEDGKYYTVMLARPGNMHYAHEYEYRYGAYLIREKPSVFVQWLEKEQSQLQQIRARLEGQQGEAARSRMKEIEEELSELKKVQENLYAV